ncbi:MAG TPA: tetratricopeptide repeat protein [bacterium]|nr:tetratricopeptide repeat protein [bacterium]
MKRFFHVFITFAVFFGFYTIAFTAQNPLYLKAQQFESRGEFEKAKEIYEKLYKSEGKDNYFWKLIRLYERTGDFKTLEDLMLKKLNRFPNNIEAKRYLSRSYYRQGEREKARRILMEIVRDSWKNTGIVKLVASEFVNQNEYSDALNVYETARKRTGNYSLCSIEMARIYEFLENYTLAIEEYLKYPKVGNIIYLNIEKLLDKAIETGITYEDLTRPFLDNLRVNPKNIVSARLLSDLMYNNGKYEDSYNVLLNPARETENPVFIWDLAERLKNDGHKNKAIEIYEDYYRYFTKAPNRINALLESASIKAELGKKENALEDYQILMDDHRGTIHSSRAALRLLELSQDKGTLEGYLKSLNEFASTTKFREIAYKAYLLLGKTYMNNGMPDDARQALNNAKIKLRNKNEIYEVSVNLALLYFFKAEYEAMNAEIETCIRSRPDGDDINDLLEFKILGMKCSSPVELSGFKAFSQGHYALFRGDKDAAIENFKDAAKDPSSVVAPYAAGALGKLYKSQHDFEEAMKWYLSAAEAAQDTAVHVGAILEAAQIAETELSSMDKAKDLYLEALTMYPGNVYESELRNKLRAIVEK